MCTMKLRSYSKYLPNKTALVTTSTFIKSADGNATYLVCCKSLMPFTLSIGQKIVTRGLAKWQTIGTPPIGTLSKL